MVEGRRIGSAEATCSQGLPFEPYNTITPIVPGLGRAREVARPEPCRRSAQSPPCKRKARLPALLLEGEWLSATGERLRARAGTLLAIRTRRHNLELQAATPAHVHVARLHVVTSGHAALLCLYHNDGRVAPGSDSRGPGSVAAMLGVDQRLHGATTDWDCPRLAARRAGVLAPRRGPPSTSCILHLGGLATSRSSLFSPSGRLPHADVPHARTRAPNDSVCARPATPHYPAAGYDGPAPLPRRRPQTYR